ncbi:unnamed protein product [Symbiodinium natans]|uniref:Uncharacterized protein n=1 Tax=Symbiodinium natans TaxID=878477 RepID=A0A812T066_9DINO|nr:unnamed protein product [Symbiodinium natans]
MPALRFSLEFGETVWGVGLLEQPLQAQQQEAGQVSEMQTVRLRTPHSRDRSEIAHLQDGDGEICGDLLLIAEWSETGVKLQLHSVRSLTMSVSRLYELKGGSGPGESNGWLLQIWGSPSVRMSEGIPFCRMGLRCAVPVPFSADMLYLERPVELQWPETWLSKGQDGVPSKAEHEVRQEATIATRCRHAMFEGTSPNTVTARSLKHWADLESWFLFGPLYARYDDELLPIDEATALHADGQLALTLEALHELRQDQDYIACHASVVRFILLSWGWDAESGELVNADVHAGQGWAASGQHAWRLRHLCLSCWLLGQTELRQSCNDFVLTLGAKAPWSEDGRSEAEFTLGRYGDHAAVEAFWDARLPPSCPAKGERTLLGILRADDYAIDALLPAIW